MGDQLDGYRDQYSYTCCGGGSSGDKVCRTITFDSDGQQRTVIGCTTSDFFDTTETTYVVETEVEDKLWPVSDPRRYGSPLLPTTQTLTMKNEPEKVIKKAAEKHCPPSSPLPSEFLTGVQIKASRIPPDDSKLDDIDDQYDYKPKVTSAMKPTRPEVSSPKAYGGGGVGKLGMPTSDIDETVDNLRGTTRPYGASKFEVEPVKVKPYVGSTYNSGFGSDHAAQKPYGAKFEVASEPVKPYVGSTYNSGFGSDHAALKAYGAKKYHEAVKRYGGAVLTEQEGGGGSNHQAALKPYGAVSCNEAAKKYGGVVVSEYAGGGSRPSQIHG